MATFARQMYWKGSTGTTGINPFSFNIAANWMEYRRGADGDWYWLASTPPPTSGILAHPYQSRLAGATHGGCPSYTDTVYIGDTRSYPFPSNYRYGSNLQGQWNPMTGVPWHAAPAIAGSPCLFGGFSGSAASGSWVGGQFATGTTFTSSLGQVYVGGRGSNGNLGTAYPFSYIGYGMTGPALDSLIAARGLTVGGSVLAAVAANPYCEKPLTLKANYWNVLGLGKENSVVKLVAAKNFASFSSATGATAKYGVQSRLSIGTWANRNGSIVLDTGSYFSSVHQSQCGVMFISAEQTSHNQSSEAIAFNGVTAGTVRLQGGSNVTFNESCRVGNILVDTGYYNGPNAFKGQLSTKDVNLEIFAGLTGATGVGAADSSIVINPLVAYTTAAIQGVYTNESAPYSGKDAFDNSTRQWPTFYIGSPSTAISTGKLIDVRSAATGVLPDQALGGAKWVIKFAGESNFSRVNLLNARICAAGCLGVSRDGDIMSIPTTKKITIGNLSAKGSSVIDLAYNTCFTNWSIGSPTCGFTQSTDAGVDSDDSTSMNLLSGSSVYVLPIITTGGGGGGGGGAIRWNPGNQSPFLSASSDTDVSSTPAEPV